MKALKIKGGRALKGVVRVSGSKNAALPMFAAALLTDDGLILDDVPRLRDIESMNRLLGVLGVSTTWEDENRLKLVTDFRDVEPMAPYEIVRTMRASILVLGPLLVRLGRAVVSLPGGCAIGARPVNIHLDGLRAMGATIDVREGYVHAEAERLHGADFTFPSVTVGGTENLVMAAVLAEGITRLHNAAQEPEIIALCELLRSMGARIQGDGTPTIVIEGVERLQAASAKVIPDRIEAGTWLLAIAATRGKAVIENVIPSHIGSLITMVEDAGVQIEQGHFELNVDARGELRGGRSYQTEPFPGFPTDLQAQWMAFLLTVAESSIVEETIFENRFMHVPELQRMGAQITVSDRIAHVTGGNALTGAPVMATDLRASASLVIAGLVAKGETEVLRLYHLERGYERLEEKLRTLGAIAETFDREATTANVVSEN